MTIYEIKDLKALLRRMQQEDPNFRVHGSFQHQYRLGPTLTESELLAFEEKHGVRLPDDYRMFLKEVGNGGIGPDDPMTMGRGGAGPFYGLRALDRAAEYSLLGEPFPFTEATDTLSEEEIEAVIDPHNFPGVPGALALCDFGSGVICYLVVNGPAYGTIWEGRENFYPMSPSFDAWYGRWVQRLKEIALPHLANERTIRGLHVGMTQAEVIALCGGEWVSNLRWAGKTHLSFKHISITFDVDASGTVVKIIDSTIYC